MYFTASVNGATNGQFTDIDFDNVDIGIYLNNTQAYGAIFSNLNLANAGNGNTRIGIYGDSGGSSHIIVRGGSFWGNFNQVGMEQFKCEF